jgi:hypothetical protein
VALTDTVGIFALRYVPPGTYHVTAFQDRNFNDRPDAFEMQGTQARLEVGAADTVITDLSVMARDTTPPRVVRAEALDSLSLRVQVDDPLDPRSDLGQVVAGVFPELGPRPALERVLHPHEWRAYQDSLRAVADSAAAAAAEEEVAEEEVREEEVAPPLAGQQPGQQPGPPAEERFLPNGERVPLREFFIRLAEPLRPGEPYTVRMLSLTNVSGFVSGDQETVVSWAPPAPPPADTGAVADTGSVADTGGVRLRLRLRPPDR